MALKDSNLRQLYRVGELDRQITLEARTEVQNDYGGGDVTWNKISDVWAKVVWNRGDEKDMDDVVLRAVSTVTFVIRYRSDARGKTMRVVYDGAYYDVKTVAEVGRKRFLELKTTLIQ